MNEFEMQLKLQAFLDGELEGEELRQVEALCSKDPAAKALLAELKMTRDLLAVGEPAIQLPESREFYWSKIQRGIVAAERADSASKAVETRDVWWRRWLMPAGALATLVLAVWLAGTQSGLVSAPRGHSESSLADTGAFTYRDFSAGTTLVWLSYPAEK